MSEILGHDIGFTLWAQCDTCGEQIMAFGDAADNLPEIGSHERAALEILLKQEGWFYLGDGSWACDRCGGVVNSQSDSMH